MLNSSLVLKLLIFLLAFLGIVFVPTHTVFARVEITLDRTNPFEPPSPPYKIDIQKHPLPLEINYTVTGCSGNLDLSVFPFANKKEILKGINSTSLFDNAGNLVVGFLNTFTVVGLINNVIPITGTKNTGHVKIDHVATWFIYAKCGADDKVENLDSKQIQVFDPKENLPENVPKGSTVNGGGYCNPTETSIDTAIGCIPTEPIPFIQAVLKLSLAAGGGVALLLMIFAAIQMITSQGSPDQLKRANGQFTNAVIGLLFIIFAVLLLQIIGVDILQIPGFSK